MPLDVLLRVYAAEVMHSRFSLSVITIPANLSLKFFFLLQGSSSVTAAEEAWARKFVTGKLHANLESAYSLQGS